MKTREKIAGLNDAQVLKLFRDFSHHVLKSTQTNLGIVYRNMPPQVTTLPEIQELSRAEKEQFLLPVEHEEAVQIARATLLVWAEDSNHAPWLKEYLEQYVDKEQAAGTILAMGSVISMVLITTSVKLERKNGEWGFSYDSSNISDNSIKLIKMLLATIPESVKKLFLLES
jgi:hypothetical protein